MKNSRFYIVLLAVLLGMYSCNSVTEPFKAKQASVVNDSVKKMMVSISNDVTMKGPIAWAYYFEDVPDFLWLMMVNCNFQVVIQHSILSKMFSF